VRLSVIMPVYNREHYVVAALRSLLRQRDDAELDVIVVDDGSTDGTKDAVHAVMLEGSCIRLFHQAHRGVASARNTGLGELLPQTQFVSFLDSDDISPSGRFKADLVHFKADPSLDLTYSLMMMVEDLDDEMLEPTPGSRRKIARGLSLAAGTFSRRLIDRIGSFDEAFRQAEDTDYLLRVFESGPRFVMPDTIALYYRRHPGNMTREPGVPLREYMRAIHKSMKRRKADPSLHTVDGIFDLKDSADWRFM
jgi:glycosyltransferase involved in cell wall biosynthesis